MIESLLSPPRMTLGEQAYGQIMGYVPAEPTHMHCHTPFQIGEYTMYASGSSGVIKVGTPMYQPKQYGFYFDLASWDNLRRIESDTDYFEAKRGEIITAQDKYGIASYIHWEDFDDLHPIKFQLILNKLQIALVNNLSVEIGCIGAHGRTGTVIAGLIARIEGLSARDSILKAREIYCNGAVETYPQMCMIYNLTGETPPPPPEEKPTITVAEIAAMEGVTEDMIQQIIQMLKENGEVEVIE